MRIDLIDILVVIAILVVWSIPLGYVIYTTIRDGHDEERLYQESDASDEVK